MNKVPTRNERRARSSPLHSPYAVQQKISLCLTNRLFPNFFSPRRKNLLLLLVLEAGGNTCIVSTGVAPVGALQTTRSQKELGKTFRIKRIAIRFDYFPTSTKICHILHQEAPWPKFQIPARALECCPHSGMDSKEPTLSRRDTHGPFARYALIWACINLPSLVLEFSDVGSVLLLKIVLSCLFSPVDRLCSSLWSPLIFEPGAA